jgi:hypothetical protein
VFGTFGIADGWRGWSAAELRFLIARAERWHQVTARKG